MNRLRFVQLIVVASLLTVIGVVCTRAAKPPPPFLITISAPFKVHQGEPIKISVNITNLSDRTIYLDDESGGASWTAAELDFAIKVWYRDGRPALLTDYGQKVYGPLPGGNSRLDSTEIAPHATVSKTCIVNKVYDMTQTDGYIIVASRGWEGWMDRPAVKSPPVIVDVVK